MLEDIAIQYINQADQDIRAVGYGLWIVGAIAAVLTSRTKAEIRRAPYFALVGLIFVAVSAIQGIWLGATDAIIGKYLWVFIAVDITSAILIGFVYCHLAMARSRDAFGHGRYAALAFIPLANFVLLFKPSKLEMSANRIPTIPLLTGILGVLTGLVLLSVGGIISAILEQKLDQRAVEQSQRNIVSEEIQIHSLIRSQGVKRTLRTLAAGASNQTPIIIDEATKLVRIRSDGTQLRRTYVVGLESFSLTSQFRTWINDGICAYAPFVLLLKEGVSIQETYVKADGAPIGQHTVERHNCGF